MAHLPASSKAAWKTSRKLNEHGSLSTRAQGKQPQRANLGPAESFVLLQDSVIRTIPPSASSPPSKKLSPAHLRNASNKSEPPTPAQAELDQPSPTPISHHLRSTLRLFNLLSSRTDIDHPLCAECTQILLSSLQRQLDETKKERDGYLAFEKEMRKEKERDAHGMSKEDAEKRIDKLKAEERLAIEHLKAAERERETLEEEMKALELEEKALAEEEAESVLTLSH